MATVQRRRYSSPPPPSWVASFAKTVVLLSVLLLASFKVSNSFHSLAPLFMQMSVFLLERFYSVLRFLAMTTAVAVGILNSHRLTRQTRKHTLSPSNRSRQSMLVPSRKQAAEQQALPSALVVNDAAYGMEGLSKHFEAEEQGSFKGDVSCVDGKPVFDDDKPPMANTTVVNRKQLMEAYVDVEGTKPVISGKDRKMAAVVDTDATAMWTLIPASVKLSNSTDAHRGSRHTASGSDLDADASWQDTNEPIAVHPRRGRSKSADAVHQSQPQNIVTDLDGSKLPMRIVASKGGRRRVTSLSCDLDKKKLVNTEWMCLAPSPPSAEVLRACVNSNSNSTATELEEAEAFIESLVPWRAPLAIQVHKEGGCSSPSIINGNNRAINSPRELGRQADAFIARFQKQMRLQRRESLERHKVEMQGTRLHSQMTTAGMCTR